MRYQILQIPDMPNKNYKHRKRVWGANMNDEGGMIEETRALKDNCFDYVSLSGTPINENILLNRCKSTR